MNKKGDDIFNATKPLENDFDLIKNEKDFHDAEIMDHFNFVDISVQKRNNKKGWTVISNLKGSKEKIKDFMQAAKKKLSCNGTIDENNNIRFNGDHKDDIVDLVMKEFNLKKEQLRIH